jgi:sterol desaturase/sphingolipid hydroxylase (fatty acid hydroxylase superfamily)
MEAIRDISDFIFALPGIIGAQVLTVLSYPLSPVQRIFILYLATSLVLAMVIYARSESDRDPKTMASTGTLFRFLFPAAVWKSSSAWLDVRYFFFHQIFRVSIYGAFLSFVSATVFLHSSVWLGEIFGSEPIISASSLLPIELLYALVSIVAIDLFSYGIHVLQHKIPLLWEFHKVHHSATVMHPLTNYREHPVDNIAYAIGTGASAGLLAGIISVLVGHVPTTPTIFGVGIFVFAFNALGYNLRHSHIWLRWPGKLNYFFGSPAHHQIHHSYQPEHVDKNFAFMFPVWDLIFGTYCLPKTGDDVRFGLSETQEDEYRTCLDLYFLPVRSAFFHLFPGLKKP